MPLQTSVLPLNGRESRFPLFCVPPAHGSGRAYQHLADELGSKWQVCAVDFSVRDAVLASCAPRSITELAQSYLSEIRHVQITGPFHLFGYSAGGLVAIEIARLLIASGDKIQLLALGDTHISASRRREDERNYWYTFASTLLLPKVAEQVLVLMRIQHPFWGLIWKKKIEYLVLLEQEFAPAKSEARRIDVLAKAHTAVAEYLDIFVHHPRRLDASILYLKAIGTRCDLEYNVRSVAMKGSRTLSLNVSYHRQMIALPGVRQVASCLAKFSRDG